MTHCQVCDDYEKAMTPLIAPAKAGDLTARRKLRRLSTLWTEHKYQHATQTKGAA